MEVARLAVQSNIFPLTEWRDGVLEKVKRIGAPLRVDDYLKAQGRFTHLFEGERGEIERGFLQQIADENARRLGIAPYGG
jgi:pyruvate ferredoxin oxidoreductase beta subunit